MCSSTSQFRIFFVTSVRLSLVTRNASTSGWRLLSPQFHKSCFRRLVYSPGFVLAEISCERNASVTFPLLQDGFNRAVHLHREAGGEFPAVNQLPHVYGPIQFFAGFESGRLLLLEHSPEFTFSEPPVDVFEDDKLPVEAAGRPAGFLRLRRVAQAQQADRERVSGQFEKVPVCFVVLHDIADIAGAEFAGLRRDDRRLGGYQGVAAGQHEVALGGIAHGQSGTAGEISGTANLEVVEPSLVIGQEKQYPRGTGYERLVVAGYSQSVLRGLVIYFDDGIEHQVAGCRRPQGCGNDIRFCFFRDGLSQELAA